MNQQPLWHEYPEDALRAVIDALGGPKKVGGALMPDKPVDDARREVDGWCDRHRKEKPTLSQLCWLIEEGRKTGCHVLIQYFGSSYRVEAIEPRDELAELQRAFIQSVEQQKALLERISRVQVRAAS